MGKCKAVGVIDGYGQEFRCTSGHEETQSETPPLKRLYTRTSSLYQATAQKRPVPVGNKG